MQLDARYSELETLRDWQTLAEELERALAASDLSDADRAALHFRAGNVLHDKLLQSTRALKHFQDAYKALNSMTQALSAARGVYWEYGKTAMVQRLLDLELRAEPQGDEAAQLWAELGDIAADTGDAEKATASYARAVGFGDSAELREKLAESQLSEQSWQPAVAGLVGLANSSDGAESSELWMRASRIARRFAADEVAGMLEKAYRANPLSDAASAAYESAAVESGRVNEVADMQHAFVGTLRGAPEKAAASRVFGVRWAVRHQKPELAERWFEETVRLDAKVESAFFFLLDAWGKQGNAWDRVVSLAEEKAGENPAFLYAQAGTIAWRNLGNLVRARAFFAELAKVEPTHPQLRAFEAQIGESASATQGSIRPNMGSIAPQRVSISPPANVPSFVAAPKAPPLPSAASIASSRTPSPGAVSAGGPVSGNLNTPGLPASLFEPTGDAKTDELRAIAQKQDASKRYNEFVKTLVALAAAVDDPSEKVDLYLRAGELYVTKFANQAEAVKAYESALAVEPDNDTATTQLRGMYEKRRDWEKLISLDRVAADRILDPRERGERYVEIAKLATERVKKPELCIDLWNEVLAADDSNVEALAALAPMYERAKDFEKLADVLSRQSDMCTDGTQRAVLLGKLATVYGEKLNNDDAAVDAWRELLALDPSDRRAQEALKKKYLQLGQWDDLEVFYADTGKWDEFIRVLEQQEAKETDAEVKRGLLFKIASLWLDKKQKSDRAARAYEKVLELEPTNLDAALALIPIYQAAHNAKALAGVLEVKLGHEHNEDDRLAILNELGGLYESKVKEPQKALDRYAEAFALAEDKVRASVDVERSAKAVSGWDKVVALYTEAVDGTSDARVMAALREKLGRVHLEELKDTDKALLAFRAVIDVEPENRAALTALERLYGETGRFSELLEVYETKRDLTSDPAARRAVQHDIARLLAKEIKDNARATAEYEDILGEDPQDTAALSALADLHLAAEDHAAYADVLRRRVDLTTSASESAAVKFALAQTTEHKLSDPAGALELYAQILGTHPDHTGAGAAVEALLDNADLKVQAAELLEPLFSSQNEPKKLARVLEIQGEAASNPSHKVDFALRTARLYVSPVGDDARAFGAFCTALRVDPTLPGTRAELEAFVQKTGLWAEIAALYKELAAAEGGDTQRSFDMALGAIQSDRLGNVDEAAAAFERVLAEDATDNEALDALEQLHTRAQRWDALCNVVERQAEVAIDARKRERLLVRAAELYQQKLGQDELAVGAYRRVLDVEPESQDALLALDALYTKSADWAALSENLESRIPLASGSEATDLRLRLGALRHARLNDTDGAVNIYTELLGDDVREDRALRALENIGRAPEEELRIAELLEDLYRLRGEHTARIDSIRTQVRRSDDASRKVELLQRAASLREDATQDASGAFDLLLEALALDPSNEQSLSLAERGARLAARPRDLAQSYDSLARGLAESDAELSNDLTLRAASLYRDEVGDSQTAILRFTQVFESDASKTDALLALEGLYRSQSDYAALSRTLQRKAEVTDDIDARKDALFQAASLEEDVLAKHDNAVLVYRKVLADDESELKALDALIRLYMHSENWEELAEIYTKKVDVALDADTKKALLYQLGALYDRELGRTEAAIGAYVRVLELDPDDSQALSRLDALYERAGQWEELLGVLSQQADLANSAEERAGFLFRTAGVQSTHLNDGARAVETYKEVLGTLPSHAPSRAALEELSRGERALAVPAALVLGDLYESTGETDKRIRALEVLTTHADNDGDKLELLSEIARVYEVGMADFRGAFDATARATRLDISNADQRRALERLASASDAWPKVAALYDEALPGLHEDADTYVAVGLRTGELYEEQLGDNVKAIERYKLVVERDDSDDRAYAALDRLYVSERRPRELAAVLERRAEMSGDAHHSAEYTYRLGRVRQTELADIPGAVKAYQEVLTQDGQHLASLEAVEGLFAAGSQELTVPVLEPLYRDVSAWTKLVPVLEAKLKLATEKEARSDSYVQIAGTFEDKLGDSASALNTWVRAIKEDPRGEDAHSEAHRLARMTDDGWDTLANGYADVLAMFPDDVGIQREVGHRLAALFENELGDFDKSEETYRYVLSIDPLDVVSLTELDRIYVDTARPEELAGVLEMRRKVPVEKDEATALCLRMGELYENELKDLRRAEVVYRAVHDTLEPENETALVALARIYEQTSAWPELMRVHEREAELVAGSSAESDVYAKMATLASTRLGDSGRAVLLWRKVSESRGEDEESLLALTALHESRGEWQELVATLARLVEVMSTDDERVLLLARRASVLTEKLARDDEALVDWQRALEMDPRNVAALRASADIRRRQGNTPELVSALHAFTDRAEGLVETDELRAAFRELGKAYGGEELAQPLDAADAWRRLLESGPDFEAFDALEQIYRTSEQPVDVVDIKMARAAALAEPKQKIAEYIAIADIWTTELEEPDQATRAWNHVMEVDPAHSGAFQSLEKLHIAAKRWEPLIELYLHRLDTREVNTERVELLRKIARVFEEKLDDKSQAFDALLQALELDFHDRETVRALEEAAQATGRWAEAIQSVQAWLKAVTEPADKIRLCLHLAKWYGDDLGHPDYAQPYYAQIVQLEPNNVGAIRQMAQLYRKSSNWQKYGTSLQRALDVATTDIDRKEILTDLGELLDKHMDQTDQGVEYFQRALKVDPNFIPAIENLERIYGARGQTRELYEILGRKVLAHGDGEGLVATKLRMGELAEHTLKEPTRAAQNYREALAKDPSSRLAVKGLVRVYTSIGAWTELAEVLATDLEMATSPRERVDALKMLARVNEEQFLKADVAAAYLIEAIDADPNDDDDEAYIALARNQRKLKRWDDLVVTLDRHIGQAHERSKKVALYTELAGVYGEQLNEPEQAIDALRNVTDLDPNHVPALEALGAMYERVERHGEAVSVLTRVAELTPDPVRKVDSLWRLGKTLHEKVGDVAQAQDMFDAALDIDPNHAPSLASVRQIALLDTDYTKAAKFYEREALATTGPRQRAKLWVDLGRLYDEQLSDRAGAVRAWGEALASDEENEDAAEPLAMDHIANHQWPLAEPLLDMLVRKSGKRDRAAQHSLHNSLGLVAYNLGNDDKALKSYQQAQSLDLTSQESIRGIADVSFRKEDWANALTSYQKVLTALPEDAYEQKADLYHRMGLIKVRQGQARQAIGHFEKALSVSGNHRATLSSLTDVYLDAGDFKQAVAYKRHVLDDVVDGEERYALLLEIADIWEKREKSLPKAVEALEEARDLKPNDLPLLTRMVGLYSQVGNWNAMADLLERMADGEQDPNRKATFLYTVAQLYRDADKLGDSARAVEMFDRVLDIQPQKLEAFERINKLLTDAKEWKQLERAYRKMLKRGTGSNTELEHTLWHGLGIIYRDRMSDPRSALEAFKMALRLHPDDSTERQIVAELYEVVGEHEAASSEYEIMVAGDPMKPDAYRALYRLATSNGNIDRAWNICAVLSFLNLADAGERDFFEAHRPRGMLAMRSRIDNEAWVRTLMHPDENLFIGKIFEMITPAAMAAQARRLQAEGRLPKLDAKFKQDPATSTVTFAKTFGWGAQVLGIQAPDLYIRNDIAGSVATVPSIPPASVAGQTVLAGFSPQELAFIVGKHLANYRGEHYIKQLFPTLGELKLMLLSAIKIVAQDFEVPAEMAQAVTVTAQQLAPLMNPVQREGLRVVVQKFIADGARADLRRWMQASELSCARAGLLLSGDLDIARKVLGAEAQIPGDLSAQDKLKELLAYSVSDSYAQLRQSLGVAIQG